MTSFLRSLREIFFFALPIIAGQLGQMLFGVGDIVVAGHYSTTVLSALGIATAIFSPFLIIGLGITYVISPLKATYLAEGKSTDHFPATSILMALISGTILSILIFLTSYGAGYFGFTEQISGLVSAYLNICALSIIPAIIFQVLKEILQAREKTLFANGLILVFNLFNVVINIFLMFTLDLGIVGAAIATSLCRTLMAVVIFAYTMKLVKFRWNVSWDLLKRLYKSGIPVGLNGLILGLVFSLVTVLVGKMSIVASATNNIIINVSSFTYMIPYALASAASVKIGRELGEKNYTAIRNFAIATVLLGLTVSCTMASLFYLIPEQIMSVATSDEKVIRYGAVLLFYVAIYQIPDSIQVITQGCLRGLGITFLPMVYGVIGIWLIGFPVGCYFAYMKGMEAAGLWSGLAIGLASMALLYTHLFVKSLRENSAKSVACDLVEARGSVR